MTAHAITLNTSHWIDEEDDLLPIMTALFVDGLQPGHSREAEATRCVNWQRNRDTARIFRLPLEPGDMGADI